MADWGNYAAYFAANSLYQAGNERAGEALLAVGTGGAGQLLLDASNHKTAVVQAFKKTQALAPLVPLRDGTWVPFSPSSAGLWLPMKELFPGEDGNRSWAYDVDIGAHHLISQRQLAPHSREARWIMDALEDLDFLGEGWFDYTAADSEADWFNRGGFSKIQPYYARNAEIYALRDDVKPFIRSYFNTLAAMVSAENLSHWEHFHNAGAFNKTHETGYFLQQTRFLFAMEYGPTLRLAPFVTDQWLKPGEQVSVEALPTKFGRVDYTLASHTDAGYILATIDTSGCKELGGLELRARHPEGKSIAAVTVDGKPWSDFDVARDLIKLPALSGKQEVRVSY
jgi:hypothetical protein